MSSKLHVALALCLSWAPLALAQPAAIRVDRVTVAQGLSHDHVLTLLQDSRGFIWAGTLDGLNRYDGYTFATFRKSPLDSTSLPGDVVYSLFEDRDGDLWVGTSGGLGRLDRSTGTFINSLPDSDFIDEPWANDVGYIYEDRVGDLWIGMFGGGLYRVDGRTGAFTHFEHDPDDPESLSFNVVEAILEDRSGALWVSTMNGLNRFERSTGSFTRFLYPAGERYEGSVVAFVEDTSEPGVFWLSTITGLVRFAPEAGSLKRFIEFEYSTSLQEGPSWSMPRGIVMDPRAPGVLWVAVPREGLYRFDTASGSSRLYHHDPDDPYSLSGEPHSLLVDATGMIWVGTDRGLNRFDPAPSWFRTHAAGQAGSLPLLHRNISTVHEGRSGALWVGTGDFLVGTALSRVDPSGHTVTHWQPSPGAARGLPDNIGINAIYEDEKGFVWIGSTPRHNEPALTRLDPVRGTTRSWRHDPSNAASIGPGAVLELYEDRSGNLWVGTSKGYLSRMEKESGAFMHFRHAPNDSTSLAGANVRQVMEDVAGNLWVGTDGGLGRLNRTTGRFVGYRYHPNDPNGLSSNDVFAMHERKSEPGILWVSTSAGLDRFDTRSGTVTHVTARDGLPKHPVVAILEDEAGRLWMSTAGAGLLRLDPATHQLVLFDVANRIQAWRFNLGAAAMRARTGEMMFGGADGLSAFRPDEIGTGSGTPPVVLTDFKLFGQSVTIGEHSPLRRPIWETEEIHLPHSENAISFDFVALHYKNPVRNRYAYRLEGLDEDWTFAGDRRSATYTNLSPGTYVFRVKAASSEGVWNETGASVRLVIHPPWWRTWWAYGLFGLGVVGAAMFVDRLRQWQAVRKERARSLLREKELRAEAAEALANYLESENRRQMQELESARTLQVSMLPKRVPKHPTAEVAAFMRTATEVGGDYYDFDVAEDGTLTMAIGDATGHGAQAGTMVAVTKAILNVLAHEQDLELVLKAASEAVRRMRMPKLYMTLALARLRGHELEIVGAGMPPGLLYRASTREIVPISLKGLPLGGPNGFSHRKQCIALSPGDTVVLMSDGLPELRKGTGEMLGYERMESIIGEVAGRSPEKIIAHLVETAKAWCDGHPLVDDMTFVVLRAKNEVSVPSTSTPSPAATNGARRPHMVSGSSG